MSTTDASDSERARPVPTIRCDACGRDVVETATDVVPRRYMHLVVDERWCLGCIRSKDEASERALNANKNDDTPDY